MTDDPTTPPGPDEQPTGPEPEPKPEPTGSGRFALYDLTELRFVGKVVDGKRAASSPDNFAKRKGHKYEVREV